jgi:hypothetical protein
VSDARTLAPALAFVGLAAAVTAQEPASKSPPEGQAEVVGLHFPHTAEDHLSVAEDYVKLAASHRKDADLHRRMLAAYERLVAELAAQPASPQKRGKTLPSAKSAKRARDPLADYRAHCEGYVGAAELLAEQADKLAEFHRSRARGLREAKDP